MTWFKIDDSFHSHPKVLATPPAALGLWVVAGAWCSSNLTDGLVPDFVLQRLLTDSAELAKQLVTSGLWRRTKGGFLFHDWLDYNPSAESVKAERDAAKKRMRELRAGRGAKDETAGGAQNGSGEHKANVRGKFGRSSEEVRDPDPTRSSSNEELTNEAAFVEIWAALPHRKTGDSKHKTQLAYNAARKRGVTHEEILDHANAYAAERRGQDPQFTKGGEAWFNTRPWDNGPPPEPEVPKRKFAWEN